MQSGVKEVPNIACQYGGKSIETVTVETDTIALELRVVKQATLENLEGEG